MKLGLMLGEQPKSVPPAEHFDSILRQVEAGQRNGIRCYLLGQHLLGTARWLQPAPLLARLAAEVDADVRLVPWVMVLPIHDPVQLAQELATLDIVSEGRLALGVGVGAHAAEFEALGIPFDERNARFNEQLDLLRRMWTDDHVTFQGRFYSVRDAEPAVRPLQQPHPPILIGASTDGGIRRAARLGDGWAVQPAAPEVLRRRWRVYADECVRLGREPQPQPMRREIVIGRDRDDALARASARDRARRELTRAHIQAGSSTAASANLVFDTSALGTAEQCADQLRLLAAEIPTELVIPRALWPGMTVEQAVDYIDLLGRELLPLIDEPGTQPARDPLLRKPRTPASEPLASAL